MLGLIQRPHAKALACAELIELQMEHVGGAAFVMAKDAGKPSQGLPRFDARAEREIKCIDFAVEKHAKF